MYLVFKYKQVFSAQLCIHYIIVWEHDSHYMMQQLDNCMRNVLELIQEFDTGIIVFFDIGVKR